MSGENRRRDASTGTVHILWVLVAVDTENLLGCGGRSPGVSRALMSASKDDGKADISAQHTSASEGSRVSSSHE